MIVMIRRGRISISSEAALEGRHWPLRKRLRTLAELYERFTRLTPYRPRPFTKSFSSFGDYARWQKKQKNPWYW